MQLHVCGGGGGMSGEEGEVSGEEGEVSGVCGGGGAVWKKKEQR